MTKGEAREVNGGAASSGVDALAEPARSRAAPPGRGGRAVVAAVALALAGCAGPDRAAGARPDPDAAARAALAPSGRLRMGLDPGTPTSVVDPAAPRGVGYELGRALAARLGVPFEPVVFVTDAAVLAALQAGTVDLAFTHATPERRRDVDFTPACLEVELGFLVREDAPIAAREDVDRAGVRVGVTAGSGADAALSRALRHATVVRAPTLAAGAGLLAAGDLDVYATDKPTLFEMAARIAGARVLEGRWGVEALALAVPRGRDAGLPLARRFARDARERGLVSAAASRAGLRGVAAPGP